ncbi:MAG: alpha/beta hydrolase [Clostridia bacterium]|jgi:monoterpene epsilon-lactone hydrolase|nr:alpha/beta hydrolase [Clostridia bacterium]
MNLILETVQCIMAILIIIFDIVLIEYVMRAKTKKPTRKLRKVANIKKNKINKKMLYEIIPKGKLNCDFQILYFHGGAYSGGINQTHWNFVAQLLKDTNANILLPDYPLVPKNTYKDVFCMVDKIYEAYLTGKKFIIIGDSAGGGISLAFAQKLGEENKKMPEKVILISPWLDITMKNEEIDKIQEKDKILNKNILKLAGNLYCGKDDPNDYFVSPINGPMDKIDNVFIFTGTYDILNPDVAILKAKLSSEKLLVFEKQKAQHNWILNVDKNKEDYQKLLKTLL